MKTKDYKFFDNLYIPAIILILIYLFGNKSKSETYFKFIICLAIPLAVTIFLNKKIIKLELEKSKRIKIVIITFFLEFLFSVQIMFLGIPIIPYLPPPLNNLFFVVTPLPLSRPGARRRRRWRRCPPGGPGRSPGPRPRRRSGAGRRRPGRSRRRRPTRRPSGRRPYPNRCPGGSACRSPWPPGS